VIISFVATVTVRQVNLKYTVPDDVTVVVTDGYNLIIFINLVVVKKVTDYSNVCD